MVPTVGMLGSKNVFLKWTLNCYGNAITLKYHLIWRKCSRSHDRFLTSFTSSLMEVSIDATSQIKQTNTLYTIPPGHRGPKSLFTNAHQQKQFVSFNTILCFRVTSLASNCTELSVLKTHMHRPNRGHRYHMHCLLHS